MFRLNLDAVIEKQLADVTARYIARTGKLTGPHAVGRMALGIALTAIGKTLDDATPDDDVLATLTAAMSQGDIDGR